MAETPIYDALVREWREAGRPVPARTLEGMDLTWMWEDRVADQESRPESFDGGRGGICV